MKNNKDTEKLRKTGLLGSSNDDNDSDNFDFSIRSIYGNDYTKDTSATAVNLIFKSLSKKEVENIILDYKETTGQDISDEDLSKVNYKVEEIYGVKKYKSTHKLMIKYGIIYAQVLKRQAGLFYAPLAIKMFIDHSFDLKHWSPEDIEEAFLHLFEYLLKEKKRLAEVGIVGLTNEVIRRRLAGYIYFIRTYIKYKPKNYVLRDKKEGDNRTLVERHYSHWRAIYHRNDIDDDEKLRRYLKPHNKEKGQDAGVPYPTDIKISESEYTVDTDTFRVEDIKKELDIPDNVINVISGLNNITDYYELGSKEYEKFRRIIKKYKQVLKQYFLDKRIVKER